MKKRTMIVTNVVSMISPMSAILNVCCRQNELLEGLMLILKYSSMILERMMMDRLAEKGIRPHE